MTTSSPSSDWMYRLFGEEFGPVDQATLQSLYDHGTLGDADEVRRVNSPRWVPYSRALLVEETHEPEAITPSDPDQEPAWFYRMGQEDLGPLTFIELCDLAQQGVLTRDCEVKFSSTGKYRRAASIGRLAAHLPYAEAVRPSPKKSSTSATTSTASSAANAPEVTAQASPVVRYHPSAEELTWYAWIRGVEYGPASLVQLSQWKQSGQIGVTDFVKYGVYGNWLPPTPTIEQALAPLTFVEAVTPTVSTDAPAVVSPAPSPAPLSLPEKPAAVTAAPAVSPPTGGAVASASPTAPSSAPIAKTPVITANDEKPTTPTAAVTKPASAENSTSPVSKPIAESKPAVEAAEEKEAVPSASPTRPITSAAPLNVARPAPRPVAKSSSRGGSHPLTALANSKILGGVAAVLVVGGLAWGMLLLPAGTGTEKADLAVLQDVLTKFRSLRESKAAESEWATFSETTKNSVAPMVERLKSTADRDHQYRQFLLWAARDRLPQMLGNAREKPTPAEDEFEYNIQKAAFLLKLGPDPDLTRTAPGEATDKK